MVKVIECRILRLLGHLAGMKKKINIKIGVLSKFQVVNPEERDI